MQKRAQGSNAQGSLEYLIIIAAVLAVAAIVVLFLTGAFGSTSSSANVAKCKEAAARCATEWATSVNPLCAYCDVDCPAELVGKCKAGAALNISSLECENNGDCDDGNECTVDSCLNGYCNHSVVDNEKACSSGLCCGGSCKNVCFNKGDCDDGLSCTGDTCVNQGSCASGCSSIQITECVSGDGCCLEGCTHREDSDCKPVLFASALGYILKSVDGVNWSVIHTLSSAAIVVYDISFLNETYGNAIASDRAFYHTADGGGTWVRISLFSPIAMASYGYSIRIFSDNLGLIGGNRYSAAGGYKPYIFRLNQTTQLGVMSLIGFGGDINKIVGIQIIDENNAWAVGSNQSVSITNGTLYWLNASAVGVVSTAGVAKLVTPENLYSVYFVNNSLGFVGGHGSIYKTNDRGNTWNKVHSSSYSIKDLFFMNESHGWAATESYSLLKTTDYGQTWSQIITPSEFNTAVFFANSTHGWIIARSTGRGIYATADGGNTWIKQSTVDTDYYSIDFV